MTPAFVGMRAVLFDFDDTLVASTVADRAALDATLVAFRASFSRHELDEIASHYAAILRDVQRAYHESGTWAFPPERFARLASVLGAPASVAPAMGDHYYVARLRALRAFPGALDVLDALRARGYRLACVTNAPAATQRRAMEHVDMLSRFDAVAIAGEEGVRKPDARIFERALARVGVPAREAVFVGDSIESDVAPAARLGMRTVLVTGAPGEARSRLFDPLAPVHAQPDVVIERVADVAALFP